MPRLPDAQFRGTMWPMTASAQNVVGLPAGGVRYQPLVIVLAAAAAGIMADRFRPLPLGAWWILAVGGLAIWIALRLARQGPRPPGVLANLVLLLAVAATAAAWHHCRWYLFPADDLGRYARCKAQPVCVEAVAVASPRAVAPSAPDPMQGRPQDDVSRLDVDLVALRNGAAWQPASGRARLTVQGPPPEIAAGDRLRVFGRLSAPSGPQNPGAFDYAARLRADGILSRLRAEVPECVSVVRPSGSWGLTRLLDQVRIQSNRLLEKHLDPRCAELAEGILLGEREQIEPDRIERFVATGAIHLLVIAGLHLGIIAGAMFWVVRRTPLSRGWANAIVAAAIVLYMLLVNTGPPVVRATVLVLVFCAAEWLGRRTLSFNSLAAALLIVLAINPGNLFHTGAQLSFLSVAGLMWFAPRWITRRHGPLETLIERNLRWHERSRRVVGQIVWRLMLVSVIIWLVTMPLVMARFHTCTPVAVLLNTVAWLPMACTLLSGFAMMIFGSLIPPLADLLGWFCNLNLWLLEWCVTAAHRIPGGHLLGPRSGRMVAGGILWRLGITDRFSAPPPAAPLVRGAAGRLDRRRLYRRPPGRATTIGSIAPS